MGHPVDVASGTLYNEFADFELPGQVDLTFGRRFSSALAGEGAGMFGAGWSSPWEMRLRRDLEGYRVVGEDGEAEITFDDPDDVVEKGGRVRNLGAFHELRKQWGTYYVTRWDPDSEDVIHYLFKEGDDGQWWPLIGRLDAAGLGVDVQRDEDDRVVLLKQRREGRALRLTYDEHGRVVGVEALAPLFTLNIDGGQPTQYNERSVLTYVYDERGLLAEVVDAMGHRTHFTYDDAGRMVSESTLTGMTFSFAYDSSGRCVETSGEDGFDLNRLEFLEASKTTIVTDALDARTIYVWNDGGQVVKEISPGGLESVTAYDEHGRIVEEFSPKGASTAYAYDENGDRVKVTSPNGGEEQHEYNSRHQAVATVDAAGNRWEREFDSGGRLTRIANPLGGHVAIQYNDQGDPVQVEDSSGNRNSMEWDWQGNMICARDWQGNVTRFEYGVEGQPLGFSEADSGRTRFRRDALGRITEVHLPDGSRQAFAYNAAGQILREVDEANAFTSYRYEGCGLLAEVEDPGGGRIRFNWGPMPGMLLAVINERGETHSYDHDAAGNVLQETDFAGRITAYEYDLDGQVMAKVDALDQRTEFSRDDEGEVTEIRHPDGTVSTFEYDERGWMVSADNGACPVERRYDACGALIYERQGEHEVNSTYDPLGNRLTRKSSLGHETAYSWDANRLLGSLTSGTCAPVLFERDALQNETARSVQGGVTIRQRQDAKGNRLEQRVEQGQSGGAAYTPLGAQAIIQRGYSHDAVGNLLELSDQHWGPARFSYDPQGQVTRARYPGRVADGFEYDAAHDVATVGQYSAPGGADQLGFVGTACTYEPGSVLIQHGQTTHRYDELGRLVRKGSASGENLELRWDDQGQLAGVTSPAGEMWRYLYDALGRRVKKIGPNRSVDLVWDGDVVMDEAARRVLDDGELTEPEVVYWEINPDTFEPVARVQGSEQHLCVNDLSGLPRELVDAAGKVVWGAQFSASGELLDKRDWQTDCPVRYPGQWYDDESGLHYNRFRYYDPSVGRYISPDPIGLMGGLNPYVYGPNAFSWIDPMGLTSVCPPGTQRIYEVPKKIPKGYKVVTRWGLPGLRSKDWVMNGKMTRMRWILSMKWQPKWFPTFGQPRNIPAKYASGEMYLVPKNRVVLPKERAFGLPMGWVKMLFSQRQFV